MVQAAQPRNETHPPFEVVEKNNALAVAIPVRHGGDPRRVFVRLGEDIVRLSYDGNFLVDLKPIGPDHMLFIRRQLTLWVVEKNERGDVMREYEAPIVAKE